ncbi:Xyloglucan galactosyltransferase KATAMARI1 [Rhynchospora pubera]|uniref:Xyloglucan galactosyltransferase KATAMARI1 n=1 Tax=Rhynchospora pubera TaxID=906938 RepID=A0AAV8BXH1_9POAL|nr:Xyloglucan galactosyltransferase KATAMARI1 [Rhynchospora pubera]
MKEKEKSILKTLVICKSRQSRWQMHIFPLLISSLLSSLFLLFLSYSSSCSSSSSPSSLTLSLSAASHTDPCSGRYLYVYDLPDKFNDGIVHECRTIFPWIDMCPYVANMGLGPHLTKTGSVLSETGWHITNQWVLEVIFHNRMRQYECLTANSSQADAFFVPYYVGLDAGRHMWGHHTSLRERDALLLELFQFLKSRPEWSAKGGRDHFILSGRSTYDLRREDNGVSQWGGKLLMLPEVKNMTVLLIESSPWGNGNEFSVPYPTNFHPSNESQVVAWQDKVSSTKRSWLFSFAGARRPGQAGSIRDQLFDQCLNSSHCKLLDCALAENDCDTPTTTMSLFQSSNFCLQPPGDTPTRRSAFDSMLAGCIPVFFHPESAYTQYKWYLPDNYSEYSVYIPQDEVREGRVRIEEVLLKYSEEEIGDMKEKVVSMIPRLIYKDPSYKLESVRDAFDVAIDGVLRRVKSIIGNQSSF